MIGSWFLAVLGKDQCFIVHFILVSESRRSTRSVWSLRLQIFEGLPVIMERKAVVNGLGLTIITVPILILEISLESTKTLVVCPAQHQGRKEFVPDRGHGECTFGICWIGRVGNEAVGGEFLDFCGENSRHDTHHTNATVSFKCLDMCNKFPVEGVIAHSTVW